MNTRSPANRYGKKLMEELIESIDSEDADVKDGDQNEDEENIEYFSDIL